MIQVLFLWTGIGVILIIFGIFYLIGQPKP